MGVKVFGRRFGLREVQSHADLSSHVGFTHDGRQQLNQSGAVQIFHLLLLRQLSSRQAQRLFGQHVVHQATKVVHNRHVFRREIRHAGGHQLDDGLHVGRGHRASWHTRDDDRCFGWRAIAHKNTLLGSGQMHAGRFDAADLHDAVRQLLLHRVVVTNLLHELACGHGGHVFEVVHASDFGVRDAFRGEQHARFLKTCSWYRQLPRGFVHLGLEFACTKRF